MRRSAPRPSKPCGIVSGTPPVCSVTTRMPYRPELRRQLAAVGLDRVQRHLETADVVIVERLARPAEPEDHAGIAAGSCGERPPANEADEVSGCRSPAGRRPLHPNADGMRAVADLVVAHRPEIMASMIELAGLTKVFGRTVAVDDLTFTVGRAGHRLPRAQRRGQDHHDADDPRPRPPDRGHGHRSTASAYRELRRPAARGRRAARRQGGPRRPNRRAHHLRWLARPATGSRAAGSTRCSTWSA